MNFLIFLTLLVLLVMNGYVLWKLIPKPQKKGSAVLLDTCALMDGRISEVVRSGFVPVELLVPRFVIAELQLLADKADHLKRERARYGLQVIQDLQDSRQAEVQIISDDIKELKGVDEKLVQVALKRGALLYTTDFNLLKVAEIEGVRVLNINALAQNIRSSHLPGEIAELKIVQKGQESSQGIGYLDDGTMVVVDKAGNMHGKSVKVEFTRTLQTAAGRMMFAKRIDVRRKAAPVAEKKQSQHPRVVPQSRARRRPATPEDKLLETINNQ